MCVLSIWLTAAGQTPGVASAASPFGQAPVHNTLTVHGLGCGQTDCGAMVKLIPPQDPVDQRWGSCSDDQPLDAANNISGGAGPCVMDYAVGSLDYPDGPPTVLILTGEQCLIMPQQSVIDGQGTHGPPDCSHAAHFLGWGGDCGANGVGTVAGGACTLVMDQDHDVYIGYSYFECLSDSPWADESQDNDARQVAGRFTDHGTFDPAQCGYKGTTIITWGPELSPPEPPGG